MVERQFSRSSGSRTRSKSRYSSAAGSAWTDLIVAYDNDSTSGTDSSVVPLTLHDFAITPSGSDITVQINAAGFFRAS